MANTGYPAHMQMSDEELLGIANGSATDHERAHAQNELDRRSNALPHAKPHDEKAVCWLLDVRKYGLTLANKLHP
jgi:hypothetical protein